MRKTGMCCAPPKVYFVDYDAFSAFLLDADHVLFVSTETTTKRETTEGGVRVDAFIRWPGMIAEDSLANDIVLVSDFFPTLAWIGGATDGIPRDRINDGLE